MNSVLKLSPNENYFSEELVGILWTEFKLFISNWKRFDLYLPLLKPKNRVRFLLPFHQSKWKQISVQIWPWTTWIQYIRYLTVPQWSSFHWKLTSFGGREVKSLYLSISQYMTLCLSVLYLYLLPMIIWQCKVWNDFTIPKYICISWKIPTNLPIQVNKILWKFQVTRGTRKKNLYQQLFADGHFTIGEK